MFEAEMKSDSHEHRSMSKPEFDIRRDDPSTPDVIELLRDHEAFARRWSFPENMYVLDAGELACDSVCFFAARKRGRLLAVGALRSVADGHVEIKSMHTASGERGRGFGKAMLRHLLAAARERGNHRVSLETGTGEAFLPARTLYLGSGFKVCPPFGDYGISSDSVCMTLDLS
tara:strand:- start:1134 stop:1652 length:519 start_codon:yes stop_codon:yes gene_type:complete